MLRNVNREYSFMYGKININVIKPSWLMHDKSLINLTNMKFLTYQ